jgi:hypothetical protein
MQLQPYAGREAPPQDKAFALKPRLTAWTARVWRESPARAIPMFKLDAEVELREVADRTLAQALSPFATQLRKLTIYILHPEETQRLAPWAVGRLDVDDKSAFMFFHDFLGAPNGPLMLNLVQTAGAATEIVMSIVPVTVEGHRLQFAMTEYDFGIHNRIG